MDLAEYADPVARAAGGLQPLGVAPGERVVLMMRNRPEFHVVRPRRPVPAGHAGLASTTRRRPRRSQYLAGHAEAEVAIVEDAGFLERFLKVRDELPDAQARSSSSTRRPTACPTACTRQRPAEPRAALDLDALAAATDARRPRHAHLHLRHDRAAEGRDDHPLQRRAAPSRACAAASALDDLRRQAPRLLPADGPHRRADDQPLPGTACSGYEVTCCPDPARSPAYAREVRPGDHVRRAPGVGEDLQRASTPRSPPTPRSKQKFDEGVAAAARRSRRPSGPARPPRSSRTPGTFLDAVAFATVRGLLGLDAGRSSPSPARRRSPPSSSSGSTPSACRCREIYGMTEIDRADDLGRPTRSSPARSARPSPAARCSIADDGEVICRGGNVFQGYLDDPEKTAETLDATAGCTPATSARSTTTATSRSSTARRS